jgi:hypothetical protein
VIVIVSLSLSLSLSVVLSDLTSRYSFTLKQVFGLNGNSRASDFAMNRMMDGQTNVGVAVYWYASVGLMWGQ